VEKYVSEMVEKYHKKKTQFRCPGVKHDLLYEPEYDHPEGHATCLQCDAGKLINRKSRTSENPVIHYGLIASGNQVMRHGGTRERLGQEHDILYFEMEAAGLMDSFPCLVIRGICAYADSQKNKQWQPYAAVTASAYAKELLSVIPGKMVTGTRTAAEMTTAAGK
jgi:nucleoside phosphorylase